MADRYITRTWPGQDLEAVCLPQTSIGGIDNPFILNGTLANPYKSNEISFINNGFIRGVSLTSTLALSDYIFTITGLQNGEVITEDIEGPLFNTVYGLLSYDIITSITVDGDILGNVSIGTANFGYLPFIEIDDTQVGPPQIAVSIFIPIGPIGSNLNWQLHGTVENVENNGISLDNMIESGQIFVDVFEGDTSSISINITGVLINFILIQITNAGPDLTDVAYVTYLQVGSA